MTSTQLESFAGRVFAEGVTTLGAVVWMAIPDLRVTQADLQAVAARVGLPADDVPKLGSKSDAFRRATSPCQRRNGDGPRYLMRPVENRGENLLRQIVRETVVEESKGKKRLHHEVVAELRYDVAAERMATNALPAGLGPDAGFILAFLQEAERNYHEFCRSLTGPEVTRHVMRLLAKMSYVAVHPHGGVYFVPRQRYDDVRKVQAFARALEPYRVERPSPLAFSVLPVPDLPEHRETVASGFTTAMASELTAIAADVAELLNREKRPQQNSVTERISMIAAARQKAMAYQELLGQARADIDNRLDILDRQCDELMERATGLKGDPVIAWLEQQAGVRIEKTHRARWVEVYRGKEYLGRMACHSGGWTFETPTRVPDVEEAGKSSAKGYALKTAKPERMAALLKQTFGLGR